MLKVKKIENGIQVSNGKDYVTITKNEDRWITVKGTHILIKDGQNVGDAVKEHFESVKDKRKTETKRQDLEEHSDYPFKKITVAESEANERIKEKENSEKAEEILGGLTALDLEPPSKETIERLEGTGISADMRLPMLWSFKRNAKEAVEKALNEGKYVQVKVAESIRSFVGKTWENIDKMPPHERRYVRDILNEITRETYKLKNRYDYNDEKED